MFIFPNTQRHTYILYRQTDIEVYKKTDSENHTDRHTERQTDRYKYRRPNREEGIHTCCTHKCRSHALRCLLSLKLTTTIIFFFKIFFYLKKGIGSFYNELCNWVKQDIQIF
jgi:hypothetical protein